MLKINVAQYEEGVSGTAPLTNTSSPQPRRGDII